MNLINMLLVISISFMIIILLQVIVKRRKIYDFHMLVVAMIIWMVLELIHYNIKDVFLLNLTNNLRYLGIVLVPVFGFTFSFKYSKSIHSLPKYMYGLLLVVPTISLISVLSNDLHYLFYTKTTMQVIHGLSILTVEYGPLFYVHTIYSYSLILIMQYNVLSVAIRHKGTLRLQSILLITSVLIPFIGNAIYLSTSSIYDFTPIFFAISAVLIYLALHQAKFFDAIPIGHAMVLSNIEIGYVITNENNRIVDINKHFSTILEVNVSQWINKPLDNLLKYLGVLQQDYNFTIYHNNKIIQSALKNIYDSREQKIGKVLTFRDITDQVQSKIKLENERNRAVLENENKTRFFSSITHELRMPIEGILNTIKEESTIQQDSNHHSIVESCYVCLNIINELENFTQTREYDIKINNDYIFLKDIIREMKIMFDPLFEQSNIQYTINYPQNMRMYGLLDAHHFQQVLINILNNIIKHAKDGSMNITMELNDDILSLQIIVNGFGIPKEIMPFIFEETSPITEFNHISLGLSLTKQIVEAMDGHITCTSNHQTQTTFSIDLMFKEIDQSVVNDNIANQEKIGLISDGTLVWGFIDRYLSNLGYQVINIELHNVKSSDFSDFDFLLLSDISLESQQVTELLSYQNLSEIPKFLISNYAINHLKSFEIDKIVTKTIKKPIHLPSLAKTINNYTKNRE